jgi:hypothetical protein
MKMTHELEWIAQKAAELLRDKVKEAPLTKQDVELALDVFAIPRLRKLNELDTEQKFKQALDEIRTELEEQAVKLNMEYWKKGEL